MSVTAKHPISDRTPIGTVQERAVALLYLAAACHMRRVEEMCAAFDKGALVMQMTLASGEEDLALIGRMQGRMGRAAMEVIGIDAGGLMPGGPVE